MSEKNQLLPQIQSQIQPQILNARQTEISLIKDIKVDCIVWMSSHFTTDAFLKCPFLIEIDWWLRGQIFKSLKPFQNDAKMDNSEHLKESTFFPTFQKIAAEKVALVPEHLSQRFWQQCENLKIGNILLVGKKIEEIIKEQPIIAKYPQIRTIEVWE